MLATSARVGVRPTLPTRRAAVVVKAQQSEREGPLSRLAAGTICTLTAAALCAGAMVPEDALAARSSGRIGGSSGFKSRRVEASTSTSSRTSSMRTVPAPSVKAASQPGRPRTTGSIGGATSRFSSKSQKSASQTASPAAATVARPREAPHQEGPHTMSSTSTAAVAAFPAATTPRSTPQHTSLSTAGPVVSTPAPSSIPSAPHTPAVVAGAVPAAAASVTPTPPTPPPPPATSPSMHASTAARNPDILTTAPIPAPPLTPDHPPAVFPTPLPSRPVRSSTTVNNVVVGAPMVAPPVYGGYGYGSPFGFSIMPTFIMPFPFLGGIIQFFFLITVVSLVFNVIRSLAANASKGKGGDKDGWGDL